MKNIRLLHKWLSLVVAIQLLIWIGSGLFFNLMDSDKTSGNENRRKISSHLVIDHQKLISPQFEQLKKEAQSIKLITLLEQPYYLLNHHQALYRHLPNDYLLIHAYLGEVVIIDTLMAEAMALTTYKGGNVVASVKKISPPIDDLPKEQNDTWQVNIDDQLNTTIYLDAGSGQIISHVNDNKRFADFFFMLHFMDYGSLGGFNNGPIIFFSMLMLLLSLSGFIWVIDLARKEGYKIVNR
jgi:hypothetical protein